MQLKEQALDTIHNTDSDHDGCKSQDVMLLEAPGLDTIHSQNSDHAAATPKM